MLRFTNARGLEVKSMFSVRFIHSITFFPKRVSSLYKVIHESTQAFDLACIHFQDFEIPAAINSRPYFFLKVNQG